jgi:hypothetical protein
VLAVQKHMLNKTSLRNFLGELPLAAELDYTLRQRTAPARITTIFRACKIIAAMQSSRQSLYRKRQSPGKKILFFATLHYWIEQAAYISLTLAGLGHKVTLLTLPYSEWHKEMDKLTQKQRGFTRGMRSPRWLRLFSTLLSGPQACFRFTGRPQS